MKKIISIIILFVLFTVGLCLFLSGTEEDTLNYLIIVKGSGFLTIYIAVELFKGLSGLQDLRQWLEDEANEVD